MRIGWRLFVASVALVSSLFTISVNAQTYGTPSPQSTAMPPQGTPMPPQAASATAQMTAKVVAIDQTNRILTLQDTKGNVVQVQAPPEVKRFNEIKIGDTINITYRQAVALQLVKPGTVVQNQATPTITRGTGAKPSGEMTQIQTATVTIQSIDMNKPSVTVKTQDGRTLTLAVQDKNNLKGLKAGDVVQITYSEALAISVQ